MREYEIIIQKLNLILKAYVPEEVAIDEDTDLVNDLGLDSLKVMKIMELVEDSFDLSVPLNVLPEIRTVKDFALQIQRLNGNG